MTAGGPRHQPGDHVRWFGNKLDWPVQVGINLVLEGASDERYFRLADRLHRAGTGKPLLGDGFHAFAARGTGGGTHNIVQNFPTIMGIAANDAPPPHYRPLFRFAVLFDDDHAGREAMRILTGKYSQCAPWRDVFLLKRRYPTDTREPRQLAARIGTANSGWDRHDCEIEDLLPKPLIDAFSADQPDCFAQSPIEVSGWWHYEFADGMKGLLCSHVEAGATLADVLEIVAVIKAIRFYLGVPVAGSDTAG